MKKQLHQYWKTLTSFDNVFLPYIIVIISIILSFFIVYKYNFDKDSINIISVILSIIIGLMFSFASSVGDKINSEHLNKLYKDKGERLDLIQETYNSAFFSIFISVITLIFCFLFILIDINWISQLLEFLLIFSVFHLFVILFLIIERLKKLLDTDVKEERYSVNKKRLDEMNETDN